MNDIWIFETDDLTKCGFILARSEEEAMKKLLIDANGKVTKESVTVYPMTALDLNKDVHWLVDA